MSKLLVLFVLLALTALAAGAAVYAFRPDLLPERLRPAGVDGGGGAAPDPDAPCPLTEWREEPAGCVGGLRTLVRDVAGPATEACVGAEMTRHERCGAPSPPAAGTDCVVGEWAPVGPCSASCGGGTRTFTRGVIRPATGAGRACPADTTHEEPCNTHDCPAEAPPVDCGLGAWKPWSACSKACGGGGVQSRARPVATPASGGGRSCGPTSESRACGETPCAASEETGTGTGAGSVDCRWSEWGPWSACAEECGAETRSRTRSVARPAARGGRACAGTNRESASCGHAACPSAAGSALPRTGLEMHFTADSVARDSAVVSWKSTAGSVPAAVAGLKNATAVAVGGVSYVDMQTNDDFVAWKPNRLQTHVWAVNASVVGQLPREPILALYDQGPQKSNGSCDGECYRFYLDNGGKRLVWNGSFGFPVGHADVPASGELAIAVVFAQSTVAFFVNGEKISSRGRIARFAEPGGEKYKYAGENHVLSFAHRDRAPGVLARGLAVYHRALSDAEVAAASAALFA